MLVTIALRCLFFTAFAYVTKIKNLSHEMMKEEGSLTHKNCVHMLKVIKNKKKTKKRKGKQKITENISKQSSEMPMSDLLCATNQCEIIFDFFVQFIGN